MNFATLKGLTIPEGVVTQITDASGRVIWAVQNDLPIILEVEKITSNTYAGETTYNSEQFILLDIYPKTNGTVSVTYGGLTKTITDTSGAKEPNAQQVFFGTFNGVSDGVETPASGDLVIEGGYRGVGQSTFASSSKVTNTICQCIRAVTDLGSIEVVPENAFTNNAKIESVTIPNGATTIKPGAFYSCTALDILTIPKSMTKIGHYPNGSSVNDNTFILCTSLSPIIVDSANEHFSADGGALFNKEGTELITYPAVVGDYTIPSSVTSIYECAFYQSSGLTSVTIPSGVTKIGSNAFYQCSSLTSINVLATTPPTLGGKTVFNGSTCPINVPVGCGEAYKTAEYWSEYADRIVEGA